MEHLERRIIGLEEALEARGLELTSVARAAQDQTVFVGRVCCDTGVCVLACIVASASCVCCGAMAGGLAEATMPLGLVWLAHGAAWPRVPKEKHYAQHGCCSVKSHGSNPEPCITNPGWLAAAEEGRLNQESALLEGSMRSSQGARVRLDLSRCPAFRLFPGQVGGWVGCQPLLELVALVC